MSEAESMTAAEADAKPSYIGALNAIVNGERGGYKLLSAWADTTKDEQLAGCLRVVAIREAEHAWAFEKRLCELGFGLKEKRDPTLADRVKLVRSDASDLEKFKGLGFDRAPAAPDEAKPDGLLALLADDTIDPQTGGLLGRFICEERDSGRRLRSAYMACAGGAATAQAGGKVTPIGKAAARSLGDICAQLADLTVQIEKLSNGKAGKRKGKNKKKNA